MNLRDQILNATDIATEQVTVPEWGGAQIEVRGMTGAERATFLAECFDTTTGKPRFDRMYPEILIACAHDPATGEKVFTAADRDALNGKAAAATERVASVAMRLSGLDEATVKEGKPASE